MAQIAGLPPSTRIHSNFPEAIYIRTGREARLLPRERFASGRMPTYREERVARLIDDVHSGRGVVVYFTSSRRDLLPAPGQLESWLGAPPGRYVSDALLYETRPGP